MFLQIFPSSANQNFCYLSVVCHKIEEHFSQYVYAHIDLYKKYGASVSLLSHLFQRACALSATARLNTY